jgi:copper oxidase (laccase) domain-containing protein
MLSYSEVVERVKGAFNSFPVAAEALAAWLLINLSSANFEVSENSLALPFDTCSGSREAFPDSRRKEGQWRERNGV